MSNLVYELELSQSAYDRIIELAFKCDCSPSDVFRKAVALFDVAVQAKERGEKIGLAKNASQFDQEIIL